jgi:hypothetical protein
MSRRSRDLLFGLILNLWSPLLPYFPPVSYSLVRVPARGPPTVTKPYKFIGLGAMDVTNAYEFIGFGALRPW